MKIAISCDGNQVSMHFGRCEKYVVFEESNGALKKRDELLNPGHEPFFLPKFLKEKQVNKIICSGIGPRAMTLFSELGIEVIPGVSGSIDEVIEKYLKDKLVAGESTCDH